MSLGLFLSLFCLPFGSLFANVLKSNAFFVKNPPVQIRHGFWVCKKRWWRKINGAVWNDRNCSRNFMIHFNTSRMLQLTQFVWSFNTWSGSKLLHPELGISFILQFNTIERASIFYVVFLTGHLPTRSSRIVDPAPNTKELALPRQ